MPVDEAAIDRDEHIRNVQKINRSLTHKILDSIVVTGFLIAQHLGRDLDLRNVNLNQIFFVDVVMIFDFLRFPYFVFFPELGRTENLPKLSRKMESLGMSLNFLRH